MNERRRFLQHGFISLGVSALACGLPAPALARVFAARTKSAKRSLSLHNLHTDEKLSVTYWKDGRYDRSAWAKLNHVLRDFRTGDSHIMDLRLLDLVHDLRMAMGNDRPVEIISGYRSPASNTYLREASTGVAKNSYHLRGMAMDLRLDGTSLAHLHTTALAMGRGGVGYYPDSEFVHVDVGPVRRWG